MFLPIPAGWLGAMLLGIFGFFFVTVSSRIVGLIGSSSNPVSGMTIATLLFTALLFRSMGWTGTEHQIAVLFVGAVVCIAAAVAGDISQDLKTGFLVGASPYRQQLGEFIGVLTAALCIGSVVLLLHRVYGVGSPALPAPQATLMSLVIEGVLAGKLPWAFVGIGMVLALVVELLGVSSLPFAVGLYLPVSLTTPIFAGGLLRRFLEGANRMKTRTGGNHKAEQGILFSSGLIAGAALVGVLLALGEVVRQGFLQEIHLGSSWMGRWASPGSLGFFLLPLLGIVYAVNRARFRFW
jgi:putative OPT family oligopeptide transporter